MTDTETPAPAAPAAGTPKPNPFQRIVGVLFSPGETFESIARRPDWVVPLLIIVLVGIVGGFLAAAHLDFADLGRQAIEMNPRSAEMSPSQFDTAARFTASIMKVSAYAGSLLYVVALIIVAGVVFLTCRLFAGEGDFRGAFSVTVYAWYPRLIKGILGTVVILSRKSISFVDLQNPVMSNLGFLFDPKTNPLGFAAGSALDIFAIWSVILLIIGFAAVTRLSRARVASIVIGWWVVVNLLTLIGPAMQALRK